MDSFYELSYMESSVQLLNLRDEIKGLQKDKCDLEQKIQLKQKEEVELSAKNLRWLKIVNQKMGADKYSPKKKGIYPPSPKKCVQIVMSSSLPAAVGVDGNVSDSGTSLASSPIPSTSCTHVRTIGAEIPKVDSASNEMTVNEAKELLDKYKGNPIKFNDDEIADDELMTLTEAETFLKRGDEVNTDNMANKSEMADSKKEDDHNGNTRDEINSHEFGHVEIKPVSNGIASGVSIDQSAGKDKKNNVKSDDGNKNGKVKGKSNVKNERKISGKSGQNEDLTKDTKLN